MTCSGSTSARIGVLAVTLALVIVAALVARPSSSARAAPAVQSLRPDVQVRLVLPTWSPSHSIRIARDPRTSQLYYAKMNG